MARVILNLPPCLPAAVSILAQSNDPTEVFVWSFILIMLLVGGLMAALYIKKWMAQETAPDEDEGFTLGDLRRLHQQGKLTTEEFEKARVQMIAATQRAANRAAEAAAEAAKKKGGVSDIDQLRERARRKAAPAEELPEDSAPTPPPVDPPQ